MSWPKRTGPLYPHINETKRCSKCKIYKPLSQYGKDRQKWDGLRSRCLLCNGEEYKDWYSKNQGAKVSAEYRKRNPQKREESRKRWQDGNQRRINLKRRGLTLNQYDDMVVKQNDVCAICEKPSMVVDNRTGKTRNLAVDHNHQTNQIRGLLCVNCNTILGHAKENIVILEKTIKYLEKWNAI